MSHAHRSRESFAPVRSRTLSLRVSGLFIIFTLLMSMVGVSLPLQMQQVTAQSVDDSRFLEPLTVSPQEGAAGTAFTFTAKLDMSASDGFPFAELHLWEPGEYDAANVQAPSVDVNNIVLVSGDDVPDVATLNMTRNLPLYDGAPCGEYTAAVYNFSWDGSLWSPPITFTITCDGTVPSPEPTITPVNLGNLSTTSNPAGSIINGAATYDGAGWSVSNAGDVNGDGFDDVIIGTSYTNNVGDYRIGSSYVVFGAATGISTPLDLSVLNGQNGFVLSGAGYSVSGAGDVNGDGFDDVIIVLQRGFQVRPIPALYRISSLHVRIADLWHIAVKRSM